MDTPHAPSKPGDAAGHARAVVLWAIVLGIVLGLAGLLAWLGAMLAIFGLGGIALLLGLACVAVGATFWRRGMLPMAVFATALALPAAAVALGEVRLDRSVGTLTVRPETPQDLGDGTFRRGSGTVFVDLRSMRFAPGSTTRIKAASEGGSVVVALPRGRCLNTEIRYRTAPQVRSRAAELAETSLNMLGVGRDASIFLDGAEQAVGIQAQRTRLRALDTSDPAAKAFNSSEGLSAWGRKPVGKAIPGTSAEQWARPSTDPDAPKVELDLTAAEPIVVRDYPDDVGPLTDAWADGDGTQVGDAAWPANVAAPLSPIEARADSVPRIRTRANRARWVAWERRMVTWGAEQAKRYAGACATRQELRDRAIVFETQPERLRSASGRAGARLEGGPTTRRSAIDQPTAGTADAMLVVEVNGLGETKVVGIDRPGVPFEDPSGNNHSQAEVNR